MSSNTQSPTSTDQKRFQNINPEEKAKYALNALQNIGFRIKKEKEQTLVSEVKAYAQSNPESPRHTLMQHVFSNVLTPNYIEDQDSQPEFEKQRSQSSPQ